jgi:hypothetical protein
MQLATLETVYCTRNYRCAWILKTGHSSLVLVALMALQVARPIHAQNPDEVRKYIAVRISTRLPRLFLLCFW